MFVSLSLHRYHVETRKTTPATLYRGEKNRKRLRPRSVYVAANKRRGGRKRGRERKRRRERGGNRVKQRTRKMKAVEEDAVEVRYRLLLEGC